MRRVACLWLGTAFGAIGCASILLNVLQARHNRELQEINLEILARGQLLPGTLVPPLQVYDLEGQAAKVRYDQSSLATVLYVFRPSCVWCLRNSAGFDQLLRQISKRYRIIAISLGQDGLREFVKSAHPTFPVYATRSEESGPYHLGSTPETIVVSSQGAILAAWNGAYTGTTKTAVEGFFSVQLPELDITAAP